MASSLRIGSSVQHIPAAVGRATLLHGANICRFGSKRLVNLTPLSCSAPDPSTVVVATTKPSPPSDLATSPVPLLLVPKILLDKNPVENEDEDDPFVFYSLPQKQIVTVQKNQKSWRRDQIRDAHWFGSSKGWIMYMTRPDCNLYLCNPFSPSTASIIPLPPIETLPCVTARRFRRSDLSSKEFDIEFDLNDWYNTTDPLSNYYEGSYDVVEEKTPTKKWFEVPPPLDPPMTVPSEDLIKRGFVSKMILSRAPPSPSTGEEDYSDCLVAIIYGYSNKLAICRIGDSSWTRLDGLRYRDIAFSTTIDKKPCLYTWDEDEIRSCHLSNPKSPEWTVITKSDMELIPTCLVESATEPGILLMVGSSYYKDAMEVHKVDTFKNSCLRVDCLEDQALFIGDFSEAMSVPASQLPVQLKPNCVYLSDFDCFELGVFDLEERVVNTRAFDDGLSLDLSGKEERDDTRCEYWVWMEQFRKEGEGWAVWVTPNPW